MSKHSPNCDLEHKIDKKTPPPLQAQNKQIVNTSAKQVWGPIQGRNIYVGFRYKLKNTQP